MEDRLRVRLPVSQQLFILAPAAAPPVEMPCELLALLAWWEAKADNALPERSALEPAELGRELPHLALLDVEEDDFRFRVTGEEIRARYGSLRGRSIRQVLSGVAQGETLAEHAACAAGRRPTLYRRNESPSDATDMRRYWRLLLPFGAKGRTSSLLAAMRFDSVRAIGRAQTSLIERTARSPGPAS